MALIRKFPLDPGLNFIGRRNLFLAMSAMLMVASVVATLVQGLNFGIDFRGGIVIEIRTAEPVDLNELRQRVNGLGIGEVTLQQFGEPTDVLNNVAGEEGGAAGDRKSVVSGQSGSVRVALGGLRFIQYKTNK